MGTIATPSVYDREFVGYLRFVGLTVMERVLLQLAEEPPETGARVIVYWALGVERAGVPDKVHEPLDCEALVTVSTNPEGSAGVEMQPLPLLLRPPPEIFPVSETMGVFTV